MSEGLGSRLTSLRAVRGISVRDLSITTGIPFGDLVALESGTKRQAGSDLVRRLSEFFYTSGEYLLSGAEPSPAVLRAGFFRFYDALNASERGALKFAPIQSRIDTALRFLETAYPTLLDRTQVAARVGYSLQALEDVLSGNGPLYSHLLKRLAALMGLGLDFFVRGDFFGGVVDADADLSPARLSEYYQVVQEAIAQGISPGTLRKAVQILAIRDQEDDEHVR
jgi:transcriptional regulator with XRE-family HTH domain